MTVHYPLFRACRHRGRCICCEYLRYLSAVGTYSLETGLSNKDDVEVVLPLTLPERVDSVHRGIEAFMAPECPPLTSGAFFFVRASAIALTILELVGNRIGLARRKVARKPR